MVNILEQIGFDLNKKYYKLNIRLKNNTKIFIVQKTPSSNIDIYKIEKNTYNYQTCNNKNINDWIIKEGYEHAFKNITIKNLLMNYNYI